MTGHIRQGSDIDIHVFSNSTGAVTDVLEAEGLRFDVERKQILKHNEARTFTHIHVGRGSDLPSDARGLDLRSDRSGHGGGDGSSDGGQTGGLSHNRFNFELTVYDEDKAHYVFRSSITGKAIERASVAELEEMLRREYPDVDLDAEELEVGADHDDAGRWEALRSLLLPLENVKQSAVHHPEGDVLYHLLQVFELAKERRAYDQEFLEAALLHDVGKGIDPRDHVHAGLEALAGLITERTRFLIEHHMDALAYQRGTLGAKLRQRLAASEHFDDLMLLRELDSAGRVPGAVVGSVAEALDYLRELEWENEGTDVDAHG
jgi:hypothetical protein